MPAYCLAKAVAGGGERGYAGQVGRCPTWPA